MAEIGKRFPPKELLPRYLYSHKNWGEGIVGIKKAHDATGFFKGSAVALHHAAAYNLKTFLPA